MKDDKKKTGNSEENQETLTPWQKENLRYLETKGDKPVWQKEEINKKSDTPLKDGLNEASEKEQLEEAKDDKKLADMKDLPKSLSFADKLPKMKEERKKRLTKRLGVIVGVFGVAALGMIYYVSPLSKLNKVEVTGNQVVTKQSIASSSKLRSQEIIWAALFNKETTTNIKKANPRIKEVSVSLSRVNNIKLTVEEFEESAFLKTDGGFSPVLENGVILSDVVEVNNPALPVILNFKEGDNLTKLIESFPEINQDVKESIAEVVATPSKSNEYLVTLKMKDGNQVVASTMDMVEKINLYPKIASEMASKGVIDIEAGIFTTTYDSIKAREDAEKAETESTE